MSLCARPLGHETETGFTEPKRSLAGQARLRVALRRYGAASFACIHERRMVDQSSASWNHITLWLRQLQELRVAA